MDIYVKFQMNGLRLCQEMGPKEEKKNSVISTDGFGYGIIARAFKGEHLIAVLGQFTLKECQAH